MLNAHRRAGRLLDAPGGGRRDLAGEQRVFRVVFKGPSAERVAVEIHAGAEDHAVAVSRQLFPHALAHLAGQFGVPGLGDDQPHRVTGRAAAGQVQPRRTVGEEPGGNTQRVQILRRGAAGGAGRLELFEFFHQALFDLVRRLVGRACYEAQQHLVVQRGHKVVQGGAALLHVEERGMLRGYGLDHALLVDLVTFPGLARTVHCHAVCGGKRQHRSVLRIQGHPIVVGDDLRPGRGFQELQRMVGLYLVADLTDDRFPVQTQHGGDACCAAVSADAQEIVVRLHHKGGLFLIVGGKTLRGEADRQRLALARLEKPGLLVGLQFLIRLREPSLGSCGVELYHLAPVPAADIGDLDSERDHVPIGPGLYCFHSKARIAQPVAEGIEGLDAEAVKVAIADEDVLGIVLLQAVSIVSGEGGGGGVVLIAPRPGVGEPPGGIDPPGQHVGERVPALAAAETHQYQRIQPGDLVNEGSVHDAGVEHHNGVGKAFAQQAQVLPLLIGEAKIALLVLPVAALACVAAQDIDRRISAQALGQFFRLDGQIVDQHAQAAPHAVKEAQGLVLLVGVPARFFKALEPGGGRQRQPRVFEALFHADGVGREDEAAARAAGDRVGGARAEEGHTLAQQG